jgi:hypothetical protein
MSTPKSWRDRLASYPHLPNIKEIPLPMRKRHFVEDFAKKLAGTR